MSASTTLQRRVQWIDTDAAGIWHHSNVVRWAEEAEAELHRQLGIIDRPLVPLPEWSSVPSLNHPCALGVSST